MPKSTLSNPRGVRGAASLCAVAALAYLFVQDLLTIFVSALMGMRVQGASLSDPVGFSVAAQGLLGIVVAAGSIVLPLWWLLRATRLQTQDLRILLPAPWSPAFCLVVFLGLANAGNLFGGLLARGLGVTTSSTALPAGGLDLFVFDLSVCQSLILESGLEKTAAAAAAKVVGAVGLHVDEIFFADYGFHHKPQVFGNGIAIAFSDNLAGILDRKFNLQVFVPVGADLEFAFTYPFGIVFVDIFYFKVMFQVEFFQSGPD